MQKIRLRLVPEGNSYAPVRWISAWVDLTEFPRGPNHTALARINKFFARFILRGERLVIVDLSQGNSAGG